MQLVNDPDIFIPVADELAIRFIAATARCLHEAPDIAFDIHDPDAAQSDMLFDICFKGAVQIEEQSGIPSNGTRYTPRVIFDTVRFDDSNPVFVTGGLVHGKIDDPQLVTGVERARLLVDGN